MTKDQQDYLKLSRLTGELLGALKGVVFWDVPDELVTKIQSTVDRIEADLEDITYLDQP